jgi:hypothetical protein
MKNDNDLDRQDAADRREALAIAGRIHDRNRQRAELAARTARNNERARAERIADKRGVMGY